MNKGRFCPSRTGARIPQACGITAFLLTIALMEITGCAQQEPVQKLDSTTIEAPAPQPTPELNDLVGRPAPAEPYLMEGSGVAVWAEGYQGRLIAGLDGWLYEPYARSTIESVQKTLRERGLYAGPINGMLDMPTMKSIYSFQEATYNLQRCGVPTPNTRKMLEQGSHTDLGS